jgi:nicotinamide-nucleotide amidase
MFDKQQLDNLGRKLISSAQTVAVAESVSSGILQAAFSLAKNAVRFFQGGITTYNIGQKSRHLLVDPIHALACNSVSEEVAESMALHVCSLFQSDWGIGVCGYAAPVPESGNATFAYYAIAHTGNIILSQKIDSTEPEGLNTQLFFANTILEQFYSQLSRMA